MSVLDGFLSTWSDAKATFGQGTPDNGAKFDQSGPLLTAQATVQSAAPGSTWTGQGASAYGTANTEHGNVLGKVAGLDQRLSGQVNQSSEVVAAGRRDLDALRQWVVDAAAAVPPGKNREQMLLPIVQKGLGQLTDIVSKSNGDLSKIGAEIRALDAEYKALAKQRFVKEGTGDGVQGVKGDEEDKKKAEEEQKKKDIEEAAKHGQEDGGSLSDGQLSPEEEARLTEATTLTPEQKAALDRGDLTIPPDRMAYLNGLSHSLDGKSPAEIKATLEKLPPADAKKVANALHMVGSDAVKTTVDPAVKPGEAGYVPATGGKENLPKSIQDIFDAPLRNNPTGDWITNPDGSKTFMPPDYNKPYKFLDEYRDIAAISNYADPELQRSSALNEGMLAESRELLEDSEGHTFPDWGTDWNHQNLDPTLQDLISASSHDPIAVHDAFAGVDGKSPNNDFIRDVYQHDWADNGAAAGELFPDAKDHSERAGQTMHAFDAYAGEKYKDLLNMNGGRESLGEVNPNLVQALAEANKPYVDDMAGANIDGTKGFDKIDSGANANNMRGLFAVIDSDPTAETNFNKNTTNTWRDIIASYSHDLAKTGIPNGELLAAAGKLSGAQDMGQYIHQLDMGKSAYEASTEAWEKKGQW
ncbi:MAG TPA: EspA/EspE family type VII secretion system effector, partial [Mycobacterium sp.]